MYRAGRCLRPRFATGLLLVSIAVCDAGVINAQSYSAAGNPETATASVPGAGAGYLLGYGDVLEVRVYGRPQLNREAARIDADGTVRLPLIADGISVVCKTEDAAANEITEKYRRFLVDPQVTVAVKEFSSQPVEVVGTVNRPGLFRLERRVRLRELLALAGGPKPDAAPSVELIRDENYRGCGERLKLVAGGGTEPTSMTWFNLRDVLSGVETSNPDILPGDYIHVPEADHVYVVGNVAKPSSIPLTGQLTIMRAIAEAGGTLPASKSVARLLRSTEKGMDQELRIDLKAIAAGSIPDLKLSPGDIVEVQTSQGKQLLKAAVSAIASNGPIYYPLLAIR